ncbi:hypothetical protein [Asticcacaulis sp. AND118]|uniref:hypothetical protein n=1 Tax=Asticcacaulis sp. AND118 TaxID=2840468 RepID=UPI001CFFAE96|nr:hypothetical protein [Asticcacaulis sp. AND118]UDF03508.1 hypothetical protein LH365_00270 [Asticcacaulis sp. AND118]
MDKVLAWGAFILMIIVHNVVEYNPALQAYCTSAQAVMTVFFAYAGLYFYLVHRGYISGDTLDVASVRDNIIADGDAKKHLIGKIYALVSFGALFIAFWQFAGGAIQTLNAFLILAGGMGVWGFTSLILMSTGYFGWLKAKS